MSLQLLDKMDGEDILAHSAKQNFANSYFIDFLDTNMDAIFHNEYFRLAIHLIGATLLVEFTL